jgi:predicted HicB family RNase H-like nuclease
MAANKEQIKQVTIRWPEDFWEAVSIAATKRRTSVQALVTEAISHKLDIPMPDTESSSAA